MSTLSELLLAPGVFSLGSAAILGAAHAITPGHGKTAVAAYLAGVRGNALDALRLGLTVTMAHTASVFVLAILAHYLAERFDVQSLHPVIGRLSGLAIAIMGAWLLWSRLRGPASAGPLSMANAAADHHGLSLRAMGISGGLVPCPEALGLLMLALSRGQSLYGLALLVSFSAGLAVVLVAIGLAAVSVLPRLTAVQGLDRLLPIMSALILIAVGLLMAL
jgi:nickel/cobalt exporter